MTTEEKANEICKRHIFDSNHYDCCMEMAEWKERKMIEKKHDWSEDDEEMRKKLLFLMEEENSISFWEGCYEWLESLMH